MVFRELYPELEAVSHALLSLCEPLIKQKGERLGLTPAQVSMLLMAPAFQPAALSARLLNIGAPTASTLHLHKQLQTLKEKEMLTELGEGDYRLTEFGQTTIQEIKHNWTVSLAGIQPLSTTDMMDLGSRLKDMADACTRAPDPPGTWCIRLLRKLDPGSHAPMMVRISQFINELRAYREDSHMAAWRGYKVNGHAWDILTYLWAEEFASILVINQALGNMGHTLDETQSAAESLVRKGWVNQNDGGLWISETGTEVWNIVKNATDDFYMVPFRNLPAAEIARTLELLTAFRKGIPIY